MILDQEVMDRLGLFGRLAVLLAHQNEHGDVALDAGVFQSGHDRHAVERSFGREQHRAL